MNYWWKTAVFYELYVDRFAGDFRGLTARIPYLVKLGVTCVHILPHYPSPMVDDGYDVSDYAGVRKELGTMEDFKTFTDAAHAAGVKVLIDFVLNHTSTDHPWFKEAQSSHDSPKRDFYLWSQNGAEFEWSDNPFAQLKKSNWIYNAPTDDYYFSTFYPKQADLNWDNPAVFGEITNLLSFWVEQGVDGFRLDAASHLIKRENSRSVGLPETHEVLKSIRGYLEKNHPGVVLLAEVHDDLKKMKTYFGDGDECHLVYHFPLTEQIFIALKNNERKGVDELLVQSADIPENCAWAIFLRHHDELSLATLNDADRKALRDYFDPQEKFRFETGLAMRMASMCDGNKDKIMEAFRLLMSLPGSPIIYYGEEIGMPNEAPEKMPKDLRKLLRGTFDWQKAEMEDAEPLSLLNQVRKLIKERPIPASLVLPQGELHPAPN